MSVLKPPVEPPLKHGCRRVCSAESKGVDGWLGGRAGQHRTPFPAGREPCFSRPESAPGPGPLVTLHLPLGTGRQRSEHSLDSCYMAFLQTQEGDRQCSGSHAGPKGTVSTLPDWAPHPRRVTRPSSTTPCRPEGFLGLSAGCPAPASMLSAKLTRPSAWGCFTPFVASLPPARPRDNGGGSRAPRPWDATLMRAAAPHPHTQCTFRGENTGSAVRSLGH